MAGDTPEKIEQPALPPNGTTDAPELMAPPAEPMKLPTRKDTSLREFLTKIDDYAPIVRRVPKLAFGQKFIVFLIFANTFPLGFCRSQMR